MLANAVIRLMSDM